MKVVDFALGDAARAAKGWTLAVVPEGYTQAELDAGLFEADVEQFVTALKRTAPFSHPDILPLLNVVKVRKASTKTGNNITLISPTAPPSSPFGTAFGAMFGRDKHEGKQIVRACYGNSEAVKKFVHAQPGLAAVNHFLVLINNTLTDGGIMESEVGWTTKSDPAWPDVAVHELGHQAFDLGDEYPYMNTPSDPPTTFTAVEPQTPNVTTVTDVGTMKWSGLLTLPQSQVPTTVRSTPCVRDHPVITANPPIPADAVGAYEGAYHHACGIFRPSLRCKMRSSVLPFCKICEAWIRMKLGHYLLHLGFGTMSPPGAGAWTHMQSITVGPNPTRMLAYNAINGTYAISNTMGYLGSHRRPDGSPPLLAADPALGTGSIGPDWTWLVPFMLGGSLHYFGHRFGSGTQGIFAMNANTTSLTATHTTLPGHASHTHVVTLNLDGAPHYIGYNSFTGDAALFRINSGTSDPVHVATMQWGPGHTAVVTLTLDGRPFALTYKMATGEVLIRHLTPPGFTMTFASASGFWTRNITHVALIELSGRPYLVRYSGIDGRASIHHVRTAGQGVDFVCTIPAPGLGGLSLLGVGAPAVGPMAFPSADPTAGKELYFYNALHRTLNITPLTLR